jgi:hypothetical protein
LPYYCVLWSYHYDKYQVNSSLSCYAVKPIRNLHAVCLAYCSPLNAEVVQFLRICCDQLCGVKTAIDLSPPPVVVHRFKQNFGKNSMTHDVVKVTYIESTDLPCSLVGRLGLHFIHQLLEVR